MAYIDPHTHMISRTTDDYEAMAAAGIVAVIEPAFWIGQARTNVGSYRDYLSHILGFERFRASQFGIQHYCCIGLNSKEANNEALAEEVMEILPGFATKEGVVAIGEIGFDEQTALEEKYFRLQLDLARELDLPVMIHTPHRDKKRGASRSMDIIIEHKLSPARVVIDHVNEETVREVTERGFWAAFSIYPHSKMTAAAHGRNRPRARGRAADRQLRLRLGHLRSAVGPEDGNAARRAGYLAGGRAAGDVRQRTERLRPEWADARDRLGQGRSRSALALRRQYHPARGPIAPRGAVE